MKFSRIVAVTALATPLVKAAVDTSVVEDKQNCAKGSSVREGISECIGGKDDRVSRSVEEPYLTHTGNAPAPTYGRAGPSRPPASGFKDRLHGNHGGGRYGPGNHGGHDNFGGGANRGGGGYGAHSYK